MIGSEFGCGPCGGIEVSALCVNTDADSLWRLDKFECLFGMEGAASITRRRVVLARGM